MNIKKKFLLLFIISIFFSILTISYLNKNKSSSQLITLTLKEKNSLTKQGTYYVLYGSDYCIYCKKELPIIKNIVKKKKIKNFFYINLSNETQIDIQNNVVTNENVKGVPCILKMNNKMEVARLYGEHTQNEILKFLKGDD